MTSMKILIVDDSITIRRIISTALKTVGYSDTVEAANGKEALAKLEAVMWILLSQTGTCRK